MTIPSFNMMARTLCVVLALSVAVEGARYVPGHVTSEGSKTFYKYVSDLKTGRTASEMGLPATGEAVYGKRYLPVGLEELRSGMRYVAGAFRSGEYKYVIDAKTCRTDVEMGLPPLSNSVTYCAEYLPMHVKITGNRYVPGHVSDGVYKYVFDTKTCRTAAEMDLAPYAPGNYCSKYVALNE